VRAAEESLRAELRKELGESVYLITPSLCSQAHCRSTILTSVACWRRSRSQCWLKQQLRLLRQEDHNRGSIYLRYVSRGTPFLSNSDGVQYTSPYSRYCIIHHLAIDFYSRHCLSSLSHIDVIAPPIIIAAQLYAILWKRISSVDVSSDLRSTQGPPSGCPHQVGKHHETKCHCSPRPRRANLAP
jgi:hypothetical protein